LENDGAERIDLEGDSSTYQMEVRGEKQNVAPQNEQHSTRGVMKDKSAVARDKFDPRTVASLRKSRALANLAGYSLHSSSEFKVGKIFKVLWSEPIAAWGTEITVPAVERSITAFDKVRRFLIIKSGERQSMCM
jgi:hypothetical protein